MTEDDIRVAMELFGGRGYDDPLRGFEREVPKPRQKPRPGLDAARFPSIGLGTDTDSQLQAIMAANERAAEDKAMSQAPLGEKIRGGLEGARLAMQAPVAGMVMPMAKLLGVPEEEFYKAAFDIPETKYGQIRGGRILQGAEDIFGAMSESPLRPFVEKLPFQPFSPASAKAIDLGIEGAGKGLKLARQEAQQAGKQILDEGQDLLRSARTDFAAPPTGAVQLQVAQAPRSQLGMYSNAEQAALNLPQAKGTGNQFLAQLSKTPGVKPAELEWTGLSDFLKARGEQPVTKAEIEQYLKANKVQVNERQLLPPSDFQAKINNEIMPGNESIWANVDSDGDITFKQMEPFSDRYLGEIRRDDLPDDIKSDLDDFLKTYGMARYSPEDVRFKDYTLPGGSNYREILLKLPNVGENISFEEWIDKHTAIRSMDDLKRDPRLMQQMRDRYKRDLPRLAKEGTFRSGHYDDPNILAHMRVTDRNDADGKKVLFVEELQSDWGQSGREYGFASKNIEAQLKEGEERLRLLGEQIRGISNRMQVVEGGSPEWEMLSRERQLLQDQQGREIDWGNNLYDLRKSGMPSAPFVSTQKYRVVKNGEELITKNKQGKDVRHIYDNPEDAAAAAKKFGGDVEDMGMQESTEDWLNLSLKRLITDAVNKGYDKVAFINGKQSAERYKLSKQIDEINVVSRVHAGTGEQSRSVYLDTVDGQSIRLGVANDGKIDNVNTQETKDLIGKSLDEVIGKDLAKKIMEGGSQTIAGENLNIGGEGMKSFYDKIVPNTVNKLLKKLGGGKLDTVQLEDGMQQLGFTITPEMRELVKSQGLPMFAKGGAVKGIKTGIDAAKQASKAARRQERVDANLQRWSGSEEKPPVYYHATSEEKDFSVFDPNKSNSQAKASFFSGTPEFPNKWIKNTLTEDYLKDYPEEKPRNIPVHLRVKNTFDFENPEHVQSVIGRAKIPKAFTPEYVADRMKAGDWAVIEDRNIQNAIKDQGFDSFFVKERGVKNLGVFNPGDIKSVFNRGSFSEDLDISKAGGGMVSADQIRDRLKSVFNFAGGGAAKASEPEKPKENPFLARVRKYKKGGVVERAGKGVKAASEAVAKKKAERKHPIVFEPAEPLKKEQIRSMAQAMAEQTSGEFVRPDPKKSVNPAGKSRKQFERERELEKTIRANVPERAIPTMDLEGQKGKLLVAVPGDPTVGGVMRPGSLMEAPRGTRELVSLAGKDLEVPVQLYGGPRYGAESQIPEGVDPAFWASNIGAARGIQNPVTEFSQAMEGAPVLGMYTKMTPESSTYALHTLDALLGYQEPHMLPKTKREQLNRLVKKGNLKAGKFPGFVGFDDPASVLLQARQNPELRKHISSVLMMPSVTEPMKMRSGLDVLSAISHPEIENLAPGSSGFSVGVMRPGSELFESAHPTYSHDIPGEFMGQTKYPIPAELAFPRTMSYVRKNILKGQPFNTMKMVGAREVIDPQYIDQIKLYEQLMKEYTGRKKGGLASIKKPKVKHGRTIPN